MHICIDARMINASGIGTYLQGLIPSLIKERLDITLLGNPKEIVKYDWSENLEIIEMNSLIYSINEQLELSIKIPKCADIFWSPHFNTPILPIRIKKRVVTIHDVFHLAFFRTLDLREKLYAKVMINTAVRLSKKIITVSKYSKSEIIKYTRVNKDKIVVIYPGTNKERFKVYQNKILLNRIRKKYNLPERFFLFVGNVKPHKNLKSLLKAFESLIGEEIIKDYYLVIVGKEKGFITGDKEIFKILERSLDLRKRVIFTGFVSNEDLPIIYNLASVFVFPSFYEGFGLPPLEAMACGCPVLVSNVASLPEVCGDAALYCDPYDVDYIAEKMLQLANKEELKEELREKGFERAKQFSWEKAAKEHIKVFKEVLKGDEK